MSSSPIVFLDIDGVLNSVAWQEQRPSKKAWRGKNAQRRYWRRNLDRRAIERLNRLLDATGAVVVVSSVWREFFSVQGIGELLRARGFRGQVIDRTPLALHEWEERWKEISDWLAAQSEPPSVWCILDDEDWKGFPPERFVRTDYQQGLIDADVERAIAIFKSQAGDKERTCP